MYGHETAVSHASITCDAGVYRVSRWSEYERGTRSDCETFGAGDSFARAVQTLGEVLGVGVGCLHVRGIDALAIETALSHEITYYAQRCVDSRNTGDIAHSRTMHAYSVNIARLKSQGPHYRDGAVI